MNLYIQALLVTVTMLGASNLLAFNKDRNEALLATGNYWQGKYQVKYVAAKGGQYSYASNDILGAKPGLMDIQFFSEANGQLMYQFDRDVFADNNLHRETDVKKCFGNGLTIPRAIVFLDDLLANAKTDAEKNQHIKTFKGIQDKLRIKEPIVALIKGKKCLFARKKGKRRYGGLVGPRDYVWDKSNGVVGDDLNVPVIGVETSADGKRLEMRVVLSPEENNGTMYQGFSTYSMKKRKK